MVRKVDTNIPPTTAVPMAIRWLAPSPVANASGIKPNTVEALVMRIGRKRCNNTDLAEYVHGNATGIHENQCSCNGQRNGKHDDERVLETFELCRQNKIDKYQCQNESKHQAG